MAEEHKDSFAETVDTAASAAHTVKGAIKAGKAISGAAKGAAAGGPYGAVAGAVWAGRKHIGKIIAVIITLLLLPVLFVLMLPGLIFGGLINAFSPADTEQPILSSKNYTGKPTPRNITSTNGSRLWTTTIWISMCAIPITWRICRKTSSWRLQVT